MTAADEAYDRLHGVDGHTQAEVPCPACGGSMRFCECMDDPFARVPKDSDDRLRESIARLEDHTPPVTPRYTSGDGRLTAIQARRSDGFMIGEDYDWLLATVGRVAGLLAAYGEAEGTPIDYEFLVHHISEAIK